jgi:hypothetical protein
MQANNASDMHLPTVVNAEDREPISRFIEIDKQLISRGTIRRNISIADLDRFVELCFDGSTREEMFELVVLYSKLYLQYVMSIKHIYNSSVGWALPSKRACELMYQAWCNHAVKYPDARFIDVGAGTGIFSYMMSQMGVPCDRIVALDRAKPTHALQGQRKFWPHVTECGVMWCDLLFVAWGYGSEQIIDEYIWTGGTCVVILGELEYGCTFPADYFYRIGQCDCESCREAWIDDWCSDGTEETQHKTQHKAKPRGVKRRHLISHEVLGWTVDLYNVPGPATNYGEWLSVNKKY